jgi:hypothetical protein
VDLCPYFVIWAGLGSSPLRGSTACFVGLLFSLPRQVTLSRLFALFCHVVGWAAVAGSLGCSRLIVIGFSVLIPRIRVFSSVGRVGRAKLARGEERAERWRRRREILINYFDRHILISTQLASQSCA